MWCFGIEREALLRRVIEKKHGDVYGPYFFSLNGRYTCTISEVSFLENSLRMDDTLFYHVNLFFDGDFLDLLHLDCYIYSFPFFLLFLSVFKSLYTFAYTFPNLINYNYLSQKKGTWLGARALISYCSAG